MQKCKYAMNWNDLRVFLAISEHASLSGAARELGINHSTVFRRLNELEEDLGVRLFERMKHGYQMTPAGERMLIHARDAEQAVQKIHLEVSGQDLAPVGKVRITAAANIARTLLPPVANLLRSTHPGITLEISVGDSDYDLNRREADIALRATSRPPEHLIGRKVMSLSWWLCGPANSEPSPMSPEELEGLPLIGADASLMRLEAFQWLESGFEKQIVSRANDLSTMAALIRAGLGFGLLPSDQPESELKRLFQIKQLKGELWLLTHPDLRNTQRVRVTWEAIANEIGQPSSSLTR